MNSEVLSFDKAVSETVEKRCPECGAKLQQSEGCAVCIECGYSVCG